MTVSTALVTGGRQLLHAVSVWSGQRAGLEGEMLNRLRSLRVLLGGLVTICLFRTPR